MSRVRYPADGGEGTLGNLRLCLFANLWTGLILYAVVAALVRSALRTALIVNALLIEENEKLKKNTSAGFLRLSTRGEFFYDRGA
jgi:hypothetical protein